MSLQGDTCPKIDVPSLLDGLPDPAVVISSDHEILAANDAYRKRFADGREVVGRPCYEVSHGYTAPCDQLGEGCPLRGHTRRGPPSRAIHVHHTCKGRSLEEITTYFLKGGEAYLEICRQLEFATPQASGHGLVGSSPAFREMVRLISLVAPHETTILLEGESGTGKELVARAIHDASSRAGAPFVPVDCSGLSETLFESELFGHEKGAFTGADNFRTGLVEAARGGTLFLDELGDVPLAMQVKLLRLVETRLFRRVGSSQLRDADFRLVCATHHNLRQMAEEGSFRRDLYYRVSTFPIRLPPLRDRLGDVPELLRSFGKRLRCSQLLRLRDDTLEHFASYDYPGNVRELLNIAERACLLSQRGAIRPRHLPREVLEANGSTTEAGSLASPLSRPDDIMPLAEVEERYLQSIAATFEGSKRELAQLLEVSERTLYRKLSGLDGD
jgi:DNA-binding NtrC family response regulator